MLQNFSWEIWGRKSDLIYFYNFVSFVIINMQDIAFFINSGFDFMSTACYASHIQSIAVLCLLRPLWALSWSNDLSVIVKPVVEAWFRINNRKLLLFTNQKISVAVFFYCVFCRWYTCKCDIKCKIYIITMFPWRIQFIVKGRRNLSGFFLSCKKEIWLTHRL